MPTTTKYVKAIALAGVVAASAVFLTTPASAGPGQVYFCKIDRGLCQETLWVDPTIPCRNLPPSLPWEFVHNYSNQGQIIYSGPNCTTINGRGPVVLSPTIGRYEAYGEFRSYKHT